MFESRIIKIILQRIEGWLKVISNFSLFFQIVFMSLVSSNNLFEFVKFFPSITMIFGVFMQDFVDNFLVFYLEIVNSFLDTSLLLLDFLLSFLFLFRSLIIFSWFLFNFFFLFLLCFCFIIWLFFSLNLWLFVWFFILSFCFFFLALLFFHFNLDCNILLDSLVNVLSSRSIQCNVDISLFEFCKIVGMSCEHQH